MPHQATPGHSQALAEQHITLHGTQSARRCSRVGRTLSSSAKTGTAALQRLQQPAPRCHACLCFTAHTGHIHQLDLLPSGFHLPGCQLHWPAPNSQHAVVRWHPVLRPATTHQPIHAVHSPFNRLWRGWPVAGSGRSMAWVQSSGPLPAHHPRHVDHINQNHAPWQAKRCPAVTGHCG